MLTTQIEAMANHSDQYLTIAVSTGHLSHHAKRVLDNCCMRTDVITKRETGWFVKLYECEEHECQDKVIWQARYPGITDAMLELFISAYCAGFRMIEFDSDAIALEGFEWYDSETIS